MSLIQFITELTLTSEDEVGLPLKTFLDELHSMAKLIRKRSPAPREKMADYSAQSVGFNTKFSSRT